MPRKRRPWQAKDGSRPVDIKATIEQTLGGPKLTCDREPSSVLGSGAHIAVTAAVVAAAPAVTAVGLTQAAVVISDLKMVAVEGSRPSARPGLEVRAP
jgi:hypothetical protein